MASSKFLIILALFFTCLSLANSATFWTRPREQTDMVNPNVDIDSGAREPKQSGTGYSTGCPHGCYYAGRNGCIRCCSNEEINSVGMQKRGRGGCRYGCCGSYAYGQCSACCSRSQATEKAKEEKVPTVWTQTRP